MQDRNLYKLLQVDPAAEHDVIAAAHKSLTSRLHPDRDASGVDAYRLQELDQAFAILSDPAQRRAYDESLATAAAARRRAMGPGHHAVGGITGRIQKDADGLGAIRLDFGRYEGWTLGELLRTDPDYLRWLSRHSSGIRYRSAVMRLLGEQEVRVGYR
ncbi:MAG TPA: DnaJ domain-containing protein [Candidatus Limnocylindrales bacterium]|nr:DnaJ domain-containing protein [Candidatus Limnocylindrales bacterium]